MEFLLVKSRLTAYVSVADSFRVYSGTLPGHLCVLVELSGVIFVRT